MREVWNVWTLCLLKMIKLKDLSASLLMLIVSLFQSVLKIMMVIKGISLPLIIMYLHLSSTQLHLFHLLKPTW